MAETADCSEDDLRLAAVYADAIRDRIRRLDEPEAVVLTTFTARGLYRVRLIPEAVFLQMQLASGKDALQAVEEASISRVRPVSMAALTTILGMSPLLTDAFFQSMAVVIMFGLGFATLLTLVVLPVLYCVFYGIKAQTKAEV